jgi:phosphoenolpyruvate-protein kinase (PTS system EI component)
MSQLRRFGARGIGLYRTEFLYMIRDSLPSEETQYQLFSKILQESSDEDVAIRVLDSGGDKPLPYLNFPREDNPSLGNRGIRFLIGRSDILKPHLRALLRAGVHGRLKTLFPMVSCIQEIYQIRQVLSEVETELHANGIEHSECYQLGIMVEIPSILFCLEKVLCEVDWISVGSNDLLQYAFAVDRGNEQVSRIYQPLQPVFLSMLKEIGAVMRRHPKKGFSLCGEMAGNPLCAPLLVGAGIHELSMAPRLIPAIRRTIRAFSLRECEALLDEAIGMDNPESVQYLIKEQMNEKKLGDIFHG